LSAPANKFASLRIISKLPFVGFKKRSKKKYYRGDDFLYSKEYFEGIDIIIDTIVFNPDLNKLEAAPGNPGSF
jgi:hypothetical protein